MKKDYAVLINEYRNLSLLNLTKVKIIGDRGLEFGYPFAKNTIGYIVKNINLPNGEEGYRVFTGIRFWHVPMNDVKTFESKL